MVEIIKLAAVRTPHGSCTWPSPPLHSLHANTAALSLSEGGGFDYVTTFEVLQPGSISLNPSAPSPYPGVAPGFVPRASMLDIVDLIIAGHDRA